MNIAGLTLRDLQYVVAVADHRHFGKAARACHVSQPALSGQIRKIEEYLGVTLFERSRRPARRVAASSEVVSVAITEVGAAVIQQARVVLEEAEKILTAAKSTRAPLAGPFRLGAIATLGPYLMPHLLAPLRKAFPRLELYLKEGLTDDLLEELRGGGLDAVLAAQTFDTEGLHVIALFVEPFLLTLPKDHPLQARDPVPVSELKAGEMVLLEDGHCLRDQTIAACRPNRRGHIKEMHVTSIETLRHLVASGAGYTLMPLLAVNEDERLKELIRYRRLEGKNTGRTIVLACRERFPRRHEVELFADFVCAHIPRGSVKKVSLHALR
ncbi:MAG TPA: LysR substrate-binding domain-containing protein [Burkholderiales bacterium]|jgi:LysR family hydrogen peroxide-inducible transcriptional activator